MNSFIKQYNHFDKEIYIIALCKFVIALGNYIIPFLSLYLISKEHMSADLSGIFITVVSLSYFPAMIIGGKLSSIRNKKVVLILLYFTSALTYLLIPFYSNIYLKLILITSGRFLLTVTEPFTNVIVNNTSEKSNKKLVFSFIYLLTNVGYAIGPLIAGFLFDKNIELIFIIDASSKILVAILIWIFLSDKRTIEINEKNKEDGFLVILKNHSKMIVFSCILLVYFYVYSQYNFSLSIFVTEVFSHNSANFYGYLMTTNAISVLILTFFITALSKNIKSIDCLIISGILIALGYGLYYFTSNLFWAIFCTMIWSIGEIMLSTNFMVYISENCHEKYFGIVSSWVNVIARIGMYLNPLITGILIQSLSIKNLWVFLFILMIFGSSGMYLLKKHMTKNMGANYEI